MRACNEKLAHTLAFCLVLPVVSYFDCVFSYVSVLKDCFGTGIIHKIKSFYETFSGNFTNEIEVNLSGLIEIPVGDFIMGETGIAEPVHNVNINRTYYLGKYEVTQKEWNTVTQDSRDIIFIKLKILKQKITLQKVNEIKNGLAPELR